MKNFLILYGVACALGVMAILVVGYPGDGKKGVPTIFGRYERGHDPLIAGR